MVEKATFRSLIKKYFDVDLLVELDKLSMRHDMDSNTKSLFVYKILEDAGVPFSRLGPGTNRVAVQIDGYACKIALDSLGKMDNRREFKYSPRLYPDVIKVYESTPNGLIATSEYVTVFDQDMFFQCEEKVRKILSRICSQYLVGDIGISTVNYMNWGVRDDGSICSLDFAYIYEISSTAFICTCSAHPMVEYDADYNLLVCPACKKKYTFSQKRKRISREAEEAEVGDIRDYGYVLSKPVEELVIDPEKSAFRPKKKEKKDEIPEIVKEKSQDDILDDMSLEDKLDLIYGGKHDE